MKLDLRNRIFDFQGKLYKIKSKCGLFPSLETTLSNSIERSNSINAKIKVLYIALKYDYNKPYHGLSYEEYNFYYTLNKMDIDIIRFDFYTIARQYGNKYANKMLEEVVFLERPDKLLVLLYKDIFDYDSLVKYSNIYGTETIIWLFDDDKRYPFTKELVNCFDKVVTTIKHRHDERKQKGINSILAQFAANHYLYRKLLVEKKYDVVFIGQNFENREEYISFLQNNGINVETYGKGWKGSNKISQKDLIKIMNESKICLNFSSSAGNPHLKFIKGRVFEVPATGSFLLTETCEELEDYFVIGKHLDVFDDKNQLLEKVKYYLKHERVREQIAKDSMIHVLGNYTFEKYLKKVIDI